MEDYIKITGLKVFAYHGVLEEEKAQGQEFFLNVRLYYDMKKTAASDNLADALNYADACAYIAQTFCGGRCDLIEAAAERVCRGLLLRYPMLLRVVVEVCKPHAPIGLPFTDVSVNMERAWHKAYLSVGSNMGDSRALIGQGVARLEEHPLIRGVACSKLAVTKPYGGVEQDDFLNGCIALETLLDPEELLSLLHGIEAEAGRKRTLRWGPRTLDLDIIFYDELVYGSDTLAIPHADMENRIFVLAPLLELCPNYRHPVLGLTVEQMYKKLENR